MQRLFAGTALAAAVLANPAAAHRELVETPGVDLERAGDMALQLVRSHPMANAQVMERGAPEQFVVRLRGERTDLKGALEPVVVTARANAGRAFEGTTRLNRNGGDAVGGVPASDDAARERFDLAPITRADGSVTRGVATAGQRAFAAPGTAPATGHAGEASGRDAVRRVDAHELR